MLRTAWATSPAPYAGLCGNGCGGSCGPSEAGSAGGEDDILNSLFDEVMDEYGELRQKSTLGEG